jgi:hypothetical protein
MRKKIKLLVKLKDFELKNERALLLNNEKRSERYRFFFIKSFS